MENLKFKCAELLLTQALEKIEIDDLIEDAVQLYNWVKDCPGDEQSLHLGRSGSCKIADRIEFLDEELYKGFQLLNNLKSKPDSKSSPQSDCTEA